MRPRIMFNGDGKWEAALLLLPILLEMRINRP